VVTRIEVFEENLFIWVEHLERFVKEVPIFMNPLTRCRGIEDDKIAFCCGIIMPDA